MDCSFCVYCDNDSPDGAYCSQQCKLADLERSHSIPSSPSSPTAPQSWKSHSHPLHSYHYRQSSTPSYDAPVTTATAALSTRPRSSYFIWDPSQQSSSRTPLDDRQLTPSSSRASLSSTTSSTSAAAAAAMSTTQAKQLAEYFNSFDAARAAKRRSSVR